MNKHSALWSHFFMFRSMSFQILMEKECIRHLSHLVRREGALSPASELKNWSSPESGISHYHIRDG